MPNRILKQSICTSPSIEPLSPFHETMFYRLIVNCDDYGRFDARIKVLKASLFPLKEYTSKQIEDGLSALVKAGLIYIFNVDGRQYIQITNWAKHQQIRNKRSKYPSPKDENTSGINCNQLKSDDINCNQMISNAPVIQSESESKSESKTNTAAETESRFEEFWKVYPRHTDKQAAQKAFQKLKPSEELLSTMLKAIERQKQSSQWQDKQFIPYPATWINGRRWEDEVSIAPPHQGRQVAAQNYEQRDYSSVIKESPLEAISRIAQENGINTADLETDP